MSDLFNVINSHIINFEDQLYTACPAIVERYNAAECTVDVYPSVWKAYNDGVLVKEMLLDRVPLHFQATQELGITFPVRKGDTILLVFSHSDTENWLTSSQNYVKPKSYRKHNINDAIAICGMFKYSKSPVVSGTEQDLNIRYKDTFIRITQAGDIILNTSNGQDITLYKNNDITINSTTTVTLNCPTTNINGDVNIDGFLTTEGFRSNDTIGGGFSSFYGNVRVYGDITVGYGVGDISLLSHYHQGDSGGTTSAPIG